MAERRPVRRLRPPPHPAARPLLGPAPRRRHARRQPPLGQGPRRRRERGASGGADKIDEFLGWCDELGVEVVTLWLLSTDNLNRPAEGAARRCCRSSRTPSTTSPRRDRWRIHPVGALDLLPGGDRASAQGGRATAPATSTGCWSTSPSATAVVARSPTRCARCCRSTPPGHHASRSSPRCIDVEHIAEHLYTKGQPDPDLVIRTSGEQRLGGLPALAERAQRVLLLRGLLARLPQGRLPAGAARLRRAAAPLRVLSPPHRAQPCRTHLIATPVTPAPYAIGGRADTPGAPRGPRARARRSVETTAVLTPRSDHGLEHATGNARTSREGAASHLRARHLGPARGPPGHHPLRGARGRAARRGGHRAGGQAAPPRAGLLRPHGAADARRPAHLGRPARRPGADRRRRRHPAGRAQPHRPHVAAGRLPARRQRHPHPRRGPQPRQRGPRSSRSSARTCRCGSRPRRAGSRPRSTAPSSPSSPAGPAWPSSTSPSRRWTTSTSTAASRASRPPSSPVTPGWCSARRAGRAWAGSAPTSRCASCAATATRSGCTAAAPSSASRSTC